VPESVRAFFEPRFGVDFSGVRVHTDSNAVQMNRELNAQAFTHGRDIYFGAGKYNLGTTSGKRLLAHELTHVVQQNDRKVEDVNALYIQRHMDVPCPVPPMRFIWAGPINRWTAANLAIEQAYKAAHPSHIMLVGSDFPTGGTPGKGPSITIAVGKPWMKEMLKGFKGLSRDLAPDIIDFTSRTIYEIKTRSGAAAGVYQLANYYKIANAILEPMGVPQFNQDFATWYPPHILPYPSRSDRKVCTQSTIHVGPETGLILYQVMEKLKLKPPPIPVLDPKSILLAAMLAALLAAMQRLGKPKHPAVAAVMIAIALAMGAKPSFAKGKPVEEALLEMTRSTGIPVDPEIEKLIRSDPALKKKLEAMVKSGKDSKDAIKIFHEALVEMKDELDKDTLRKILYAANAMPGGEMATSKEVIKEELRKIRAGLRPAKPSSTGIGGKGTATKGPSSVKVPGVKGAGTAAVVGKIPASLSPVSMKKISAAPTSIQKLFIAITSGKTGPTVTDSDVDKFLKLVLPYDLDSDEVNKLIGKIGPGAPKSVDALMSIIMKEIEKMRLTPTTDPDAPPISPEELKRLSKQAIKILKLARGLKSGDSKFFYNTKYTIAAGKSIAGFYAVNYKSKIIGGSCNANILEALGGGKFKIHIPAGIYLFTSRGKYLGASLKSVISIFTKNVAK